MCTLTFAPNEHGFLVGMNRDELLTRPAAFPPKVLAVGDSESISPSEPEGGTWIACNRFGNLLAILNWRCIDPTLLAEKTMSRGFVIPKLIGGSDRLSAANQFNDLQLAGCLPFRLVGIFPSESAVHEWSWDGVRKGEFAHPW